MIQLQGGFGEIPPERTPAEWDAFFKAEREKEVAALLKGNKGDVGAALREAVHENQHQRQPGAMCDELGLAIVGLEGEANRAWKVARYLDQELKKLQADRVPPSHRPFVEEAEKLRAEVERLEALWTGAAADRDAQMRLVQEARAEISRLTAQLAEKVRVWDRLNWTETQWAVARAAAEEVGRVPIRGEVLEFTVRVEFSSK